MIANERTRMATPTQEERDIFFRAVANIVEHQQLNWIEAVVHYCQEIEMEIETAVVLIDERLKAKLTQTAEDLHLIQRVGRLPL